MVEILHERVGGRARFRVEGLYRSSTCKAKLEQELLGRDFVQHASASVLTGNVLVHFNSGNTPNIIAREIQAIVSGFTIVRATTAQPSSALVQSRVTRPSTQSRHVRGDLGSRPAMDQSIRLWHALGAGEILAELGVSKSSGLSETQVRENAAKYGRNILPESEPRSRLAMFISQFQSLPVALLSAAAAVSLLTGGVADTFVILGVVGINACIGYVTESQAERTIQSLKKIVHPTALVLRNSQQVSISDEEIVPGDILVLRPGVYVPADGRLIEAEHLSIDESALTGESLPALKSTCTLHIPDLPMADRKNMIYMGTLVTGGQGLAIAVATGRNTELGQLQIMVAEAEAPKTPMEKELTRIGNQLVLISGGICGVVFIMGLIRGAGFIQVFKTSIALAVAAVPEGLPAVATTTLALGIRDMKRKNVLIRRLAAVETLGSVQTICFDKTGTVTQNRMSVKRIWVTGRSLEMQNGRPSVDCGADPLACEAYYRLLQVCVLCNESEVIRNGEEYLVHGTSTENALMNAAMAAGLDAPGLRKRFRILKTNHRTEDRHFMGVLHEDPIGDKFFSLKGNPLEVLAMCDKYLGDNGPAFLTPEVRCCN